ncbi:hypothetical protein BC751_0622 [Cecembia calidifontis]|uniref:Uncharacterized protein n=1 Tax=Cecembia calidifontis TaxID=1187080 RepID=A0A4Q7P5T5_9BACT|nr:hypothetical protein BC751_0622 [Cecembia calidifontis]
MFYKNRIKTKLFGFEKIKFGNLGFESQPEYKIRYWLFTLPIPYGHILFPLSE